MKSNCYIVSRNGACPICNGTLYSTPSGRYRNCADCKATFKVLEDDLHYGGDHDAILEHLNPKKANRSNP